MSQRARKKEADAETILTGTERAPARHSLPWGPIGFMMSMAIPVAVIVAGLIVEGAGADVISWTGAIVWGVVATLVFTMFSMMGKAMGMTEMDLLDLLGSAVARPKTAASKAVGMMVHLMNGVVLAVGWVYFSALIGVQPDWRTALVWGAILWALALLMMTTMGSVHPAIRRGDQHDPGPAATNFGSMTPMGSLAGHLVWAIVLAALYAIWP